MMGDNHETFRELLPAFALGSLDTAESAALAAHIKECPECADELTTFQHVADSLGLAVPQMAPLAGLRERVLSAARATTPLPAAKATPTPRRAAPRPLPARRAWPVMAVVALAAVVIGGLLLAALAGLRAVPPVVALLPTDLAPEAAGELRFGRDGQAATLEVFHLPPLPADQAYQLWLLRDGERDSGAVFDVNENGWAEVAVELPRPAAQYNAFGITIEPSGGSPGPTGERVLGSGG